MMIKRPREQPLMITAKRLGNNIYRAYKKEQKDDCQDLLLEWVGECFWGKIVKEHIPIFKKSWNILYREGHDKNNKFVYGDVDVGVWYEKTKNERRKVIVSERYCSMADDNIHIFVLDEYPKNWGISFNQFKAVTVWPREKKSTLDHKFGDDRDIDIPSLNTYRKRDFDYGYNDCRDKGHCFKYEKINNRVEKPSWLGFKIQHALQTLRWDLGELKELEQ